MADQRKDGGEPSLHDQAFWDQETNQITADWQPFSETPLNRMDAYQMAEFVNFVWSVVVRDHKLLAQLATEQPEPTPMRPRRRARTSKNGSPTDDGPDAA